MGNIIKTSVEFDEFKQTYDEIINEAAKQALIKLSEACGNTEMYFIKQYKKTEYGTILYTVYTMPLIEVIKDCSLNNFYNLYLGGIWYKGKKLTDVMYFSKEHADDSCIQYNYENIVSNMITMSNIIQSYDEEGNYNVSRKEYEINKKAYDEHIALLEEHCGKDNVKHFNIMIKKHKEHMRRNSNE